MRCVCVCCVCVFYRKHSYTRCSSCLINRAYLFARGSLLRRGDTRLSPIIVVSQLSRPYRFVRIFNIHARSTHTTCTRDIRNEKRKKKSSFATQPNLISQGRTYVCSPSVYAIMYIYFYLQLGLVRVCGRGGCQGARRRAKREINSPMTLVRTATVLHTRIIHIAIHYRI